MVEWRGRVIRDPEIMMGKPAIAGTRITVELILDYLAGGETVDGILSNYPHLSREVVLATLAYASDAIRKMTKPDPACFCAVSWEQIS